MSTQLYYPKRTSSIEIIANSLNIQPDTVSWESLLSTNHRIKSPSQTLSSHQPIIIPNGDSQKHISLPLCTRQEHQRLSTLNASIGGAATMALAELVAELNLDQLADMNTFGGNGLAGYVAGTNHIIKKVNTYDEALKEYENYKNHRAAPQTRAKKRAAAQRAFREMNDAFNRKGQTILNKHVSRMRNAKNVRGRAVQQSIPIGTNADIHKLTRFAKAGKLAAPGFILVDGALRGSKIYGMLKDNDPRWKRELFIQGGAFLVGAAAGAAIAFFIAPLGVGFLVGAVAAGSLAILSDRFTQQLLSTSYDKLSM